ncbi:MAG: dephospho-CoA kinase [Terracidiphilus sp.]
MLRVGLTGSIGSGKSTIAGMLGQLGAQVMESDDLGRSLMEPGQPVFDQIVQAFGPAVLAADGRLDRARLAEIAFRGGRLDELNRIVHPAVVDAQMQWMNSVFERDPSAIAVIVSALIFEAERDARSRGERDTVLSDLRRRIDCLVVVTAPDDLKVRRYVERLGLSAAQRAAAEADARSRLAHQIPDAEKAARADYVLENVGDRQALWAKVDLLWQYLQAESNKPGRPGFLK